MLRCIPVEQRRVSITRYRSVIGRTYDLPRFYLLFPIPPLLPVLRRPDSHAPLEQRWRTGRFACCESCCPWQPCHPPPTFRKKIIPPTLSHPRDDWLIQNERPLARRSQGQRAKGTSSVDVWRWVAKQPRNGARTDPIPTPGGGGQRVQVMAWVWVG